MTIRFIQRKETCDEIHDFTLPENSNKCCCLLSGGLDSAVGAMWTLNQGFDPIFVSHSSSPALSDIQTCVAKGIAQVSGREFRHIIFPTGRSKKRRGSYRLGAPPASPLVQHLRSFFFLILATAIAFETECRRVYIFENGPLALNPLASEAHTNIRTVHPLFLQEFRSTTGAAQISTARLKRAVKH